MDCACDDNMVLLRGDKTGLWGWFAFAEGKIIHAQKYAHALPLKSQAIPLLVCLCLLILRRRFWAAREASSFYGMDERLAVVVKKDREFTV